MNTSLRTELFVLNKVLQHVFWRKNDRFCNICVAWLTASSEQGIVTAASESVTRVLISHFEYHKVSCSFWKHQKLIPRQIWGLDMIRGWCRTSLLVTIAKYRDVVKIGPTFAWLKCGLKKSLLCVHLVRIIIPPPISHARSSESIRLYLLPKTKP